MDEELGDAERQQRRRRGDRVALRDLVRLAAEERLARAVAEAGRGAGDEIGDTGLRDGRTAGARMRRPAPRGDPVRAASQSARWPPAEWPTVATRVASTPSRPGTASAAAAASSSVPGQPPPSCPTRRYSMFQAAKPRASRDRARAASSASGPSPSARSRRGSRTTAGHGPPSPAAGGGCRPGRGGRRRRSWRAGGSLVRLAGHVQRHASRGRRRRERVEQHVDVSSVL